MAVGLRTLLVPWCLPIIVLLGNVA